MYAGVISGSGYFRGSSQSREVSLGLRSYALV